MGRLTGTTSTYIVEDGEGGPQKSDGQALRSIVERRWTSASLHCFVDNNKAPEYDHRG